MSLTEKIKQLTEEEAAHFILYLQAKGQTVD